MNKRPYNLQLQTPGGECAAAADTLAGLVEITPRGLLGESRQAVRTIEDTLDSVARDLWAAFLFDVKECRKSRHSKISRAGLELDLVKCYLNSLTIDEVVSWFKTNRGLSTSRSAIGRYWNVLSKIGPDFKARL